MIMSLTPESGGFGWDAGFIIIVQPLWEYRAKSI